VEIIREGLSKNRPGFGEILLHVDRQTLAKCRWRGVANDGREFGFDLAEPLSDGTAFFETEEHRYLIAQTPEPVLELRIVDCGLRKGAEIAWKIGNLHCLIGFRGEILVVADDPALRQLFAREHIAFTPATQVFNPLRGAHSHGYEH